METVLIANPKGGSGKTTLAVNVAALLANNEQRTALLDLDRQQSACLWLSRRSLALPPIHRLEPVPGKSKRPDWLVIDSPAGLHGKELDRAIRLASRILVPVSPSLFDMHASRDFLLRLSEEKALRKGKVKVGVVGMRMASRTRSATALEQFLEELEMPVMAYLRDTQSYVNTLMEGKSVFDLPWHQSMIERRQWATLQLWLEE
jgi:chromosome partitioning protein